MAFAVLSSAPAAWNPLLTNLALYDEGLGFTTGGTGRMALQAINPADLTLQTILKVQEIPTGATGVGVPGGFTASVVSNFPQELIQFIQLAQLGWGAQLGTNRRINFWAAAELIAQMIDSLQNQGVPFPR